MRIRYTATALLEVAEILGYIATNNPSAATRVSAEIERTLERLSRYPFSSALETDKAETRIARVRRSPYLIFYTVAKEEVVILHVRHGSRLRP
jgi:plasmid stabilization system protein ParE